MFLKAIDYKTHSCLNEIVPEKMRALTYFGSKHIPQLNFDKTWFSAKDFKIMVFLLNVSFCRPEHSLDHTGIFIKAVKYELI